MRTRHIDDYLRAKEALAISLRIGHVHERNQISNEDAALLEECSLLLTNMFYDDYVDLKDEFEPEGLSLSEGMRWH